MSIELVSAIYCVSAINRKTQAAKFKDWRVGDHIRFETYMKGVGGASGGGVYASTFYATNITQGTTVAKSQNEMVNVLSAFEFEECGEDVALIDAE
jgi:hypothetical protein